MKHSFTKILVHLIWRTKNGQRIIFSEKAIKIRNIIIEHCNKNGIILEGINIQPEHIHALIEMQSDKTVKDIVKSIKGASSHYINEKDLFKVPFSWQRGYGAFSIGNSQVKVVKDYITNQSEHHKRRTFSDEWKILLDKYGISFDENH